MEFGAGRGAANSLGAQTLHALLIGQHLQSAAVVGPARQWPDAAGSSTSPAWNSPSAPLPTLENLWVTIG